MKSFKKIIFAVTLLSAQQQIHGMDWSTPKDKLRLLYTGILGLGMFRLGGFVGDQLILRSASRSTWIATTLAVGILGYNLGELGFNLADVTLKNDNIFSFIRDNDAKRIVLWLVLGGNINSQDLDGNTPLIKAVQSGNMAIVQILVKRGAAIDIKDQTGMTALMFAVQQNNKPMVKYLLQQGAATLKGPNGATLLHLAAEHGTSDMVALFVQKGLDINALDDNGMTPLMYAVTDDAWYNVKYLLDHGADIDIRDNNGQTAFDIAQAAGSNESLAFLEQYNKKRAQEIKDVAFGGSSTGVATIIGSYLGAQDQSLDERLVKAAMNNDVATIHALLEQGANSQKIYKRTRLIDNVERKLEGDALVWAMVSGNNEAVQELLKIATPLQMKQALGVAAIGGQSSFVAQLITKMPLDAAVINRILLATVARQGIVWKEEGVQRDYPAVIWKLLESGADPLATNADGQNSIQIAQARNDHEIVKILKNFLDK